ncbi:hypothetical protein V8C35DRAFT_326264 [Trichoderma chlorosporum]
MHLLYRSSSMTATANSPRSSAYRRGCRSLRGFLTCRARYVKCSLEQPACSNCLQLSTTVHDGKNVVIIHGNKRGNTKSVSRREILSCTYNICTSKKILAPSCYSDTNQSVDVMLKNLERQLLLCSSSKGGPMCNDIEG